MPASPVRSARLRSVLALTAGASLLCVAAPSDARPARPGQIPNGFTNGCANCHVDPRGGGPRNPFGVMIEDNFLDGEGARATVMWGPDLAALDADNDGFTNGEELGDPDGAWSSGDAPPDTGVSLPGDDADTPCGNGVVDFDEECDGDDLAGATCADFGFEGGTPTCSATCAVLSDTCTGGGEDVGPGADVGGTDAGMTDTGTGEDAGMTDTGMTDTGSETGGGGSDGCATANGRSGAGWLVLAAMVGLVRRRRA